MSSFGLAKLFREASGCVPQACLDALRQEVSDKLTTRLCTEAEVVFKMISNGSDSIVFDEWIHLFSAYIRLPDSHTAKVAFGVMDIDKSGSVAWWEFKLIIAWACREYATFIHDVDSLHNVIFKHLILPNMARESSALAAVEVEEQVRQSSVSWMGFFNNQEDPAKLKLADMYSEFAVLHVDLGEASPWFSAMLNIKGSSFVCRGRSAISMFWQVLASMVKEFKGFEQESPCTVCVESNCGAILQSKFTTDSFKGWIHGRYVVRDDYGQWVILADHLELTELLTAKVCKKHDISYLAHAEGTVLEGRQLSDKQVRQSLFEDANEFKREFNAKSAQGCAAAYADETVMRSDISVIAPLMKQTFGYEDPVVLRDKGELEIFWSRMINDVGLHSMQAYEGTGGKWPISICILDDNMGLVSSSWRMNTVGGHIHCQRMERSEPGKPWLVMSDFFSIYQTYDA